MDNLLRQEMTEFKSDLHEMKVQMKELYQAIVGSKLLKDGGLVGQFSRIEARVDKLEKRADEQDDKIIKFTLYQKLIWAGVGVTATGIISYLIQVIFHK